MRLRTATGRYDVPICVKTASTVIMKNDGELAATIEQSVAVELKPVTVDTEDVTANAAPAAEMSGDDSEATLPV